MHDGNTAILVPGTSFGNYKIEKLLGRGGMGEVYLASAPGGALHAVKVLYPDVSGSGSDELNRFVREAEFMMTVRHPNIVEVYDAGIDPDTGLCFLTMEFMPGGTLRQLLDSGVKMSFSGVSMIAADIARALALVEANGMVHRDVKPDNIMFAADGTAKLADLGISRFGKGSDARVTRVGETVGTPAYMSPEQMLDSHSVDIRSDLYSLGVVMYEMITGRRPNEGENAMCTLANAIGGRRFPDVRTLRAETPPELAMLVGEMTHPSADGRPSSARMVLEMLSHPERIAGYGTSAAGFSRPWYRDRGVLYAATAMVLAAEALAVALATVYARSV